MPAGAETSQYSPPPIQAEKATARNIRGKLGRLNGGNGSHLQGAQGVSASANVSVNVSTRSCLCKVKEEAPASRDGGGWGKGEQGLGY